MSQNLRVCALVSGGGSTLLSILNAIGTGVLQNVEIACVGCSPGSGFTENYLEKTHDKRDEYASYNVSYSLDPTRGKQRLAEDILEMCEKEDANFLAQLGWLPKTPPQVVDEFRDRSLNQHPGPLHPGHLHFGGDGMWGMRVHATVLYFRRAVGNQERMWTAASAQRVAHDFDEGALIHEKHLAIEPDDTPETLKNRLLPLEHEVQIEALRMFAENNVAEIVRSEPLIDEREDLLLAEAMSAAKLLYPKG